MRVAFAGKSPILGPTHVSLRLGLLLSAPVVDYSVTFPPGLMQGAPVARVDQDSLPVSMGGPIFFFVSQGFGWPKVFVSFFWGPGPCFKGDRTSPSRCGTGQLLRPMGRTHW